ncbi:MAG: hypothetical protein LBE86_08955 [Gemmobacter sp.]|jgi:hypothetical protein|nr:hypothetical protein [Gemmobacter sp.]
MSKPGDPPPAPERPAARKAAGDVSAREERLKAALKANMARRKAQARARNAAQDDTAADNGE